MKEQARNTEVQIKEEEIGKLPEKEFRIMIAKTVPGILQARTLEWVAISFSNA